MKTKQKLKEELYQIFDKVVINFKASDTGNITWSDRDEMNKRMADNFIDKVYENKNATIS